MEHNIRVQYLWLACKEVRTHAVQHHLMPDSLFAACAFLEYSGLTNAFQVPIHYLRPNERAWKARYACLADACARIPKPTVDRMDSQLAELVTNDEWIAWLRMIGQESADVCSKQYMDHVVN